jgi:hypothetical protein
VLNINIRLHRSAEQEAALLSIPRGFDADGDADAARPDVPLPTIVFWRNVPSRPKALGPYDIWEKVEGNTSRILGAGGSEQVEEPGDTPVEQPVETPVEPPIEPPVVTPVVTSPGVISGAENIGIEQTVTGFFANGGGELTYQWRRNGRDIAGATKATYTPTSADENAQISRRTTVTNAAGSASGATPARAYTYPAGATIKSWTSRVGATDWSDVASSPFRMQQNPWGLWASNAGSTVLTTTARRAAGSAAPSMRTVTSNMPVGDGLPKAAPKMMIGYHYHLESPMNPFKEGSTRAIASDAITSLRARFDGTDFGTDPNRSHLQALQLYMARDRFQGAGWAESGAGIFDLQIRSGTNFYCRNWPGAFGSNAATTTLGGVLWKWKREMTSNIQMSGQTRAWTFEPVNPGLNVGFTGINVKSILEFIVAHEVAIGAQPNPRIWVYGVQTWVEPRAGIVDYSIHSFGVGVTPGDKVGHGSGRMF